MIFSADTKTITVSGSRDIDSSAYSVVHQWIDEAIFGSVRLERIRFGGARGVDSVALLRAVAAIDCKVRNVEIQVIVPTTMREQPKEARDAFHDARGIYDRVELIELGEPAWNNQRHQRRNIAMLVGRPILASQSDSALEAIGPKSDLLLAFWNGHPGGTKNCVESAMAYGILTCVVPIMGDGDD